MIVDKLKTSKMNQFVVNLSKLCRSLGSYLVALLRLGFWIILAFFSGLQRILFTRAEVIGMELKLAPLRCDLAETGEKLAYIDKLCLENPELVASSMNADDEEFFNDIPFDDEDN